jgi:hypothetical protein
VESACDLNGTRAAMVTRFVRLGHGESEREGMGAAEASRGALRASRLTSGATTGVWPPRHVHSAATA